MPNVLKYVKARSFTLQSQCAGIHSHNPGLCCVCGGGGDLTIQYHRDWPCPNVLIKY